MPILLCAFELPKTEELKVLFDEQCPCTNECQRNTFHWKALLYPISPLYFYMILLYLHNAGSNCKILCSEKITQPARRWLLEAWCVHECWLSPMVPFLTFLVHRLQIQAETIDVKFYSTELRIRQVFDTVFVLNIWFENDNKIWINTDTNLEYWAGASLGQDLILVANLQTGR